MLRDAMLTVEPGTVSPRSRNAPVTCWASYGLSQAVANSNWLPACVSGAWMFAQWPLTTEHPTAVWVNNTDDPVPLVEASRHKQLQIWTGEECRLISENETIVGAYTPAPEGSYLIIDNAVIVATHSSAAVGAEALLMGSSLSARGIAPDQHLAISHTPVVVYDRNAVPELRPFILRLTEVVDLGIWLAAQQGVSVEGVHVYRFVSREDPTYKEFVVSLYSSAPQEELAHFFSMLAEQVGVWRRRQTRPPESTFASQIGVEVMPAELWEDVRP